MSPYFDEFPQAVSLEAQAIEWIHALRDRYSPAAEPLPRHVASALRPYFSQSTLARVRVAEGQGVIADPPFYFELLLLGFANLPCFALAEAMTIDHLVIFPGEFDLHVLFHELVHVVQYEALGLELFVKSYLHAFLSSGSYDAIPLEITARALEQQYCSGASAFDAEALIRRRLETDGSR